MAYELNGVTYEADEEGYLVDISAWNKDLALLIAKDENIEMNDDAWEVVNFLRNYYEEYQIAPAVRVLTKASRRASGRTRATASTSTNCSRTAPPNRPAKLPVCQNRRVVSKCSVTGWRRGAGPLTYKTRERRC